MCTGVCKAISWNVFAPKESRAFGEMADSRSGAQNVQEWAWNILNRNCQLEGTPKDVTLWVSVIMVIILDKNALNIFKSMNSWWYIFFKVVSFGKGPSYLKTEKGKQLCVLSLLYGLYLSKQSMFLHKSIPNKFKK